MILPGLLAARPASGGPAYSPSAINLDGTAWYYTDALVSDDSRPYLLYSVFMRANQAQPYGTLCIVDPATTYDPLVILANTDRVGSYIASDDTSDYVSRISTQAPFTVGDYHHVLIADKTNAAGTQVQFDSNYALAASQNGQWLLGTDDDVDVWVSSDSGATFVNRGNPGPGSQPFSAAVANDGTIVLLVRADGVYTSDDGGATWTPQPAVGPVVGEGGVSITADGQTIYYGAKFDNGLWRSDDGGGTWTGLGQNGSSYAGLTVFPFDATKVLSTNNHQASYSTDSGVSFTTLALDTGTSNGKLSCSDDGSKVILSGEGFSWFSTDSGHSYAALPDATARAVSGDGLTLVGLGSLGAGGVPVWSTDAGVTWLGFPDNYVYSSAIRVGDNLNTIFTEYNNTTDGGATWRLNESGTSSRRYQILIDRNNVTNPGVDIGPSFLPLLNALAFYIGSDSYPGDELVDVDLCDFRVMRVDAFQGEASVPVEVLDLFVTTDLKPVDPAVATAFFGEAGDVLLSATIGDPASFGVNQGTGGALITVGTPTEATPP